MVRRNRDPLYAMAVFVSTTSGEWPQSAHSHTDCANFEDSYELDQCMAMRVSTKS